MKRLTHEETGVPTPYLSLSLSLSPFHLSPSVSLPSFPPSLSESSDEGFPHTPTLPSDPSALQGPQGSQDPLSPVQDPVQPLDYLLLSQCETGRASVCISRYLSVHSHYKHTGLCNSHKGPQEQGELGATTGALDWEGTSPPLESELCLLFSHY